MIDLNFGELEGPQLSNIMGGNPQQQMANMRGRTPSQGSMNGQRLQGPGAMANYPNALQQPRHPNFWLQPITMEQVVKKLNVSLARLLKLTPMLIVVDRDQGRKATVTGPSTDPPVHQRYPLYRHQERTCQGFSDQPGQDISNQRR